MLVAALACLTSLTTATGLEVQCPRVYEPLNKTLRRVGRADLPLSWGDARDWCANLPGFELLGRDVLTMSAQATALCADQEVPFGARNGVDGVVVWDNGKKDSVLQPEVLNRTYLSLRRGAGPAAPDSVGSLHTTRRTWRLVAEGSTRFRCALCQRAWPEWLGQLKLSEPSPPPRAPPYVHAYAVVVASDVDAHEDAEFLDMLQERVNGTLGQVSVEVTGYDLSRRGTHVLRLLSSQRLDADMLIEAVNASMSVLRWRDMDFCEPLKGDALVWERARIGRVLELRLSDFTLATRACSFRRRRDDDFDAAWNAVVYWLDHEQRCLATPEKTLLDAIHALALGPAALPDLVALTDAVRRLQWPKGVAGFDARDAVLRDVAAVVTASLTAGDADDALVCEFSACAFVFASRPTDTDREFQLRRGVAPAFSNLSTATADRDNASAFDILVGLPPSPGGVAGHLFQDHEFNIFYQARPGVWFTYWTAALVQVAVADASADPALAVTFRVARRAARATLGRFWAAWDLTRAGAPQPCLLVRSDALWDAYRCAGAGSFVAYAGLEPWADPRAPPFPGVRDAAQLVAGYAQRASDAHVVALVAEVVDGVVATDVGVDACDVAARAALQRHLEAVVAKASIAGPCLTVDRRRVKVAVCLLQSHDAATGVSLAATPGDVGVALVGVVRNESRASAVDLVVSVAVRRRCARFGVVAVTEFADLYPKGLSGSNTKSRIMVVHVVLTLRADAEPDPEKGMYFDLQLNMTGSGTPTTDDAEGVDYDEEDEEDAAEPATGAGKKQEVAVARHLRVAFWDERTRDWSTRSCAKRKSTREQKLVFRCGDFRFTNATFAGRYLILDVFQFTDFLGTSLLLILIFAGVLSFVSLVSIAGTAAVLPSWRKDLGHKILLQMALALSFNLALGFTSSLVSVDTASVECVAIGVLRHFSYLAMFAWMLVMSGLQLRRLLSVLGSRNTPNLLVTVAALAWGLPVVSVASLLQFNYKMYQSDAADRGFCYPEGAAFLWSVQIPAATVLTLNALIFAVILARLYGCGGWGETQDLRRHLNERVFQMRRLRAVFFIFCLFGLAWVFHLLAEQGVIQEKFLFEYLFLVTASVHVFSLSCIFVLFDADTRSEWVKVVARLQSSHES